MYLTLYDMVCLAIRYYLVKKKTLKGFLFNLGILLYLKLSMCSSCRRDQYSLKMVTAIELS